MTGKRLIPWRPPPNRMVLNIPMPPLLADQTTLEPPRTSSPLNAILGNALFEGLTKYNKNTIPQLAQASEVHVRENSAYYLFTIRPNRWSDGSPVTAHDFVLTWQHLLTPGTVCSNVQDLYYLKHAKQIRQGKLSPERLGTRAVDDMHLEVWLEKPTPFFLHLTASYVYFPLHATSRRGYAPHPLNTAYNLISNGPYCTDHWVPNVEIVMLKNLGYYRQDTVAVNEVHINFLHQDLKMLCLYAEDHIDGMIRPYPTLTTCHPMKQLIKQGIIKPNPMSASTCCLFNTTKTPFHNTKLRRAFSMAIDRKKIARRLTLLGERPASNFLPPHFWPAGYIPATEIWLHNLVVAKELFAEALEEMRITPERLSKMLVIAFPLSDFYYNLAEELLEQWQLIFDVRVNLERLTLTEMTHKMQKKHFYISVLTWTADYDHPISLLGRFKEKNNPKNYIHWHNPVFSRLLQRSIVESDRDNILALCMEAEALLLKDAPLTPLFHGSEGILHHPRITHMEISPFGVLNLGDTVIGAHRCYKSQQQLPYNPCYTDVGQQGDCQRMLSSSIIFGIPSLNGASLDL